MEIEFKKLSKNVGAEVFGFEIASLGKPGTAAALRDAFSQFKLLKFYLPNLSAEHQANIAEVFGKIHLQGTYGGNPKNRLNEYVSNTRADGTLGNGPFHFHHDHLFYEEPLSALMLYGMEIPTSGSATKFRDAHGFYERLPAKMKDKLVGIEALHMKDFATNTDGTTERLSALDGAKFDTPQCWRPLVWTDPRTNEPKVLLSPAVEDFKGVSKDRGYEILRELLRVGRNEDDPETTYVHEWSVGDLIVWDNLALAHARPPFDSSEPRTLRRTPIQ